MVIDDRHVGKTVEEMKAYARTTEFKRMIEIHAAGMQCPCGGKENQKSGHLNTPVPGQTQSMVILNRGQ